MSNEHFLQLVREATKGKPAIKGVALGEKPTYFVVGDEPVQRDFMIGRPFSGNLGPILRNAFETLHEKYGASPSDCYTTYFVKTIFKPGELTEDDVVKLWLPILQLEYMESGCSVVVCVGKMAKLFANMISQKPPSELLPKVQKATFAAKVRKAWQVLRS